MNQLAPTGVKQLSRVSVCALAMIALASCSPGPTPPPTFSVPSFTPAHDLPSAPHATETDVPSANPPAVPSPVGAIPISPGPVIDVKSLDLLVPLAEIGLEAGGLAWSPDGHTLAV